MSRAVSLPRPIYIDDDLRRRLPWVLSSAFILWGALLWIFGLLLGQLETQPELLGAVDAQFIELRSSGIHGPGTKHATGKSIREPAVSTIPPESVNKPVSQTPPQSLVSGSEANSQSNEQTITTKSDSGSNDAGMLPQSDRASIAPPRFGAAYLNNPKPAYPAFAKRMGMEGTVMLKVLVSREGTALKVEVAHSSGYETLDKAATEAVKNWRFIPASRALQPVDEWVQVPVAFRLKK